MCVSICVSTSRFCVVFFLEECPNSFSHRHNGKEKPRLIPSSRFTNGKKEEKKGHAPTRPNCKTVAGLSTSI